MNHVLIALGCTLCIASPVMAQERGRPFDRPLFAATESAEAAPAAQPGSAASDRPFLLRAHGGLITGVGEMGFVLGGAVAMPLQNYPDVEVGGDVSFGRLYGGSLVAVTGWGLYHIETPSVFKPYLGAGLAYSGVPQGGFEDSVFGLQLIAGFPLPIEGPYKIRLEGRLLTVFAKPIILTANITF